MKGFIKFGMTTAGVAAVAFSFGTDAQAAVLETTIDFEEFETPLGFNLQSSPFTLKGFTFTAITNEYGIARNNQSNIPNTGSNTLVANGDFGDPNTSFSITKNDGGEFNLISLLAGEGRNTTSEFFDFSARSIQVIGTLAAGGDISTTLNLDLFAEENNALDFEQFSFAGFTGLSSVQFTGFGGPQNGYSFAVDDIVLSTGTAEIPTPALLPGLIGMGVAAFRKKCKGEATAEKA
ncbi:MAG: PTPA-CTERM sorting domain-containing protein, partial [Cyanobacteria bacterium P01_H01_bin.21]